MRWSSPSTEASAELRQWHEQHTPALAGVEDAWVDLLRRMSGHRPARFEAQCEALSERLDELDRPTLLPVPDPLLDLYVKRLLEHLDAAVAACRAGELFNVVYRLEEARSALAEVRWLLSTRELVAHRTPGRQEAPEQAAGPSSTPAPRAEPDR